MLHFSFPITIGITFHFLQYALHISFFLKPNRLKENLLGLFSFQTPDISSLTRFVFTFTFHSFTPSLTLPFTFLTLTTHPLIFYFFHFTFHFSLFTFHSSMPDFDHNYITTFTLIFTGFFFYDFIKFFTGYFFSLFRLYDQRRYITGGNRSS